jgi:hypothetical protein
VSGKGLLFIDANQYLDLYRMANGKLLLSALVELREYIFVTDQIAEEVQRRKVQVAADFLIGNKLAFQGIPIPDHLLSSGDGRVAEIREQLDRISEDFKGVREKIKELSSDLVQQVSQSKDEVSNALTAIFYQAATHGGAELENARLRKERGNPPGKKNDPLGDQLSWEQLLSKCHDKPPLWIITRDSDYATRHEGKPFLNAALYKELVQLYRSEPEIYCFDNLAKGLEHFAANAKVKADKLPAREETEQIKKEQESLPPLDWPDYLHSRSIFVQPQSFGSMLQAALRSQLTHGVDIFIDSSQEKDENKS